jgi:multidrug efflux system membrane fusion protein
MQRGPQGVYVYVVSAGNVAKTRTVTPAQTSGNDVGITAGIQPGDVVVIDGQDKLQDGSKVEPRTATGGPVSATGSQ